VLFAICEELLTNPTPETLESLACLLTVVGPQFDVVEWQGHSFLVAIFNKVKALTKQPKLSPRVRCLLQDVLELRASRWHDRKPKKVEGPSTLKEVADIQAAQESSSSKGCPSPNRRRSSHTDKSDGKHSSFTKESRHSTAKPQPQSSRQAAQKEGYQRINSLASLLKRKDAETPRTPSQSAPDADTCHKEVIAVVRELRTTHSVDEAISRISDTPVPREQQATEICEVLSLVVEESAATTRKVCFDFVARLVFDGCWEAGALQEGLTKFVEEVCPELKCDVPLLPTILKSELHPALENLIKEHKLAKAVHDILAVAC